MKMKTLDKKQIPQFAALCVVTAGVFGYLVVHLVAPGTASAGTRPAPPAPPALPVPAAGPVSAAVPNTAGAAATVASTDIPDAPPPSPAMHDPFAVGYVDPAATTAAAVTPVKAPALPKLPAPGKKIAGIGALAPLPAAPGAPALPVGLAPFPVRPGGSLPGGMIGLPAKPIAPILPAAPAAPSWTVTGVLLGASGKVAILRSGDARRIVRAGDFVDGTYRVAGVTRTSVVLRHGAAVYQLMLGGAKADPVTASPATAAPARPAAYPSAPASVPMPQSAAVLDGTLTPLRRPAPAHSPLAHLKHQEQVGLVAEAPPSVPAAASVPAADPVSPAKVAAAVSLEPRLLDGSVLAQPKE